MDGTHTTGWYSAGNGDEKVHNPSDLVGSGVYVNSASIQWRGVDAEVTNRLYDVNGDSNVQRPISDQTVLYAYYPSPQYDFSQHVIEVDAYNPSTNNNDLTITLESGDQHGNSDTTTVTLSPGEYHDGSTWPYGDPVIHVDTNYSGDETFLKVSYDENSVEYKPDASLYVKTSSRGSETNVESTTDPKVSNDVSADSGGITLNDGEKSSWFNLSGLGPDDETFYHDIDGSYQTDYRFEFDWEYATPEAVATKKFSVNGTDYQVALADPSDNALDYNFWRVKTGQNGILAYDVVDPSDSDALQRYIYHPIHGKLALREKN